MSILVLNAGGDLMKKAAILCLCGMIFLTGTSFASLNNKPININEAQKPAKYQLALYYRPGCPYCEKVITFLKKNNISIPLKNISAYDQAREYLLKNGGKVQVPCLFINGKALYESSDIIDWVNKNKKNI